MKLLKYILLTVKLHTVGSGFEKEAQMDSDYSDLLWRCCNGRSLICQFMVGLYCLHLLHCIFCYIAVQKSSKAQQVSASGSELINVKMFNVHLKHKWVRDKQKLEFSWPLFGRADGIFKSNCSWKEKTTEIEWVVVMGIIIKGADGFGGYQRLAGYF